MSLVDNGNGLSAADVAANTSETRCLTGSIVSKQKSK